MHKKKMPSRLDILPDDCLSTVFDFVGRSDMTPYANMKGEMVPKLNEIFIKLLEKERHTQEKFTFFYHMNRPLAKFILNELVKHANYISPAPYASLNLASCEIYDPITSLAEHDRIDIGDFTIHFTHGFRHIHFVDPMMALDEMEVRIEDEPYSIGICKKEPHPDSTFDEDHEDYDYDDN